MAGIGGSFQRALGLAIGLARRGHSVTVLASRRSPGLRRVTNSIGGVTIVEQPDLKPQRVRHGGLSLMDAAGRLAWLRRSSLDIVQGMDHRPAVSAVARVWKRRTGGIFVSDWADLWGFEGIAGSRRWLARATLGKADDLGEGWVRSWADGVTAISRDLAARAAAIGQPEHRVLLLPPGAYGWLGRAGPVGELRRKFGLPAEVPIAASAGFAEYDEDLLIGTMVDLARRDTRLHILSLGSPHRRLASALRATGAEARHHNLGFVPTAEVRQALACADVFVLPYSDRPINRGRFPNKVGEYLAAGRPLVTNPTGDVGRLLEVFPVGVLAAEDPHAMADAVLRLLEDGRARQAMGTEAERLASHEFSWDARGAALEDFYRGLIGS
jgi:glycosyltransferase involved in cell wall biosynthesis